MIEILETFLSARIELHDFIMTHTFFITLMISFGAVCAVGLWLIDGYKQDQETEKQERLNRIKWIKK